MIAQLVLMETTGWRSFFWEAAFTDGALPMPSWMRAAVPLKTV